MAIPPDTELDRDARTDLALGAWLALGPLAWFFDLVAIYAVSTHECGRATYSWLLLALGAALTLVALFFTNQLRKAPASRSRAFLIEVSLLLNALSLLLLLGFAVPLAMLRPCE